MSAAEPLRHPLRLLIHGASGRMGTRIGALALADDRFEIAARIGRSDDAAAVAQRAGNVDVVVDFTSELGARSATSIAADLHAALLIGTTALSAETLDAIGVLARSAPVMLAPNTSLGIAVMNRLARDAARLLGPRFDVHLLEQHHALKKDAPSGTALRLAATIRETGAELPDDHIFAIRAGDVAGRHEIRFSGAGEEIVIFHYSTTRDVFARGALEAAAWLAGRPPGRYSIEDALGMEEGEGTEARRHEGTK